MKIVHFYIYNFIPLNFHASTELSHNDTWNCAGSKKYKYKNVFINQTVAKALPQLNVFISYKKYLPSRDNTAAFL